MNKHKTGVRPETLALDAQIKQILEQGDPRSTKLWFPGDQPDPLPASVIQDDVLEPVDKLIWMTLSGQVYEIGGYTTFPSYAVISKTSNVSSSATISRALTLLRLTRWLTLCTKHEGTGRCTQGNVYALHDEPLPWGDTLYLDASYRAFLQASTEHYHGRVQSVAQAVLDEIDEEFEAGRTVCAEVKPIECKSSMPARTENDDLRRNYSFSAEVMNEPSGHSPPQRGVDHPAQNRNVVEHRVLKAVSKQESSLIYPRRLSEEQRNLADEILRHVPAIQRQNLLDELEGRIRAEKRGMTPLYDELNFLTTLCKALNKGAFKFNLGVKVQKERMARKAAREKRETARSDRPDDTRLEELRREIKAGRGPLADIRQILKMPNPFTKETEQ